MLIVRTVDRVKMYRMRLWLVALALQASLAAVSCAKHHRRSMANQAALPVSKGGWRPVVGSSGLLYGSLGTAPLHAPSYKLPVLDYYPSSARPIAARDATKLTSIAQSYRPTTLRTVPSPAPSPPAHQPINSYLNPFSLPNNGLSHYKFVQNFPVENVVIRNPHNPYSARPVLQKYQSKPKQQFQNNVYQQLTNIQPLQFGQYQTQKPLDIFGNPIEVYVRPDSKRQHSADTEIFKPEVYKLPDNEVSPQSVSQQVKTAQQQNYGGNQKFTVNPYANYAFQDSLTSYQQFPPSILGTFGSFGVQSVKGRDPIFSQTKTTYIPPQPTKQTIFNSFSYSPGFKSTPSFFATTTPKLLTTPNQYLLGSTLNDVRTFPTQQTKVTSPPKIDPNVGKGGFKPSPQDPFSKNIYNLDYNKITTYNPPIIQSTTVPNPYYPDYDQYTGQQQHYNSKPIVDYRYEIKNHNVNDNVGVNQHVSQQYANPPSTNLELEDTNNFKPYKSTYEVTEEESEDIITHSSTGPWAVTPESHNNHKSTEETVTVTRTTTPIPELPEEYAIVTEGEKGYENSLNYDGQIETQSRRPLGDDFEPIVKHKLKDYYYKVSTPSYGDHSAPRRTKKPTESSRITQQDITTTTTSANKDFNDQTIEALPTLPPNKHFKRPSTPEPLDKDRIRKRNKIRRRRPPQANGNRFQEENNTRKNIQSSTEPPITTEPEEIHTIRPRVRPSKARTEPSITTPTVTTDLTTSALPTISPTTPTVLTKKSHHRKPLTTTAEKPETTTQALKDDDQNKDSSIMKIATRPQFSRNNYDLKSSEVPDYSHKQDEKDTPTSDVSVSLSDTLKTSETLKDFSFHRDVRPVEITTTESLRETNESGNDSTTTSRTETRNTGKVQRPRLKNKYERPRFSVKDYRNRLSSTTSTTEKPTEAPKARYQQRKAAYSENGYINENENNTERKRFMPKDPRYKINRTENEEPIERQDQTERQPIKQRQRQTTAETENSTQKISSRIRNGQRRPRPTEETVENSSPTTVYNKRPLRKKIKDSEIGESVQDVTVTETTVNYDHRGDQTSERSRSESAIMKIADKKHHDHLEHIFEHSKRVSDLTLAASKDYNTPGMFKTVSTNSRRIPNYFTIATDDPILPIEAFFPQLNQKKES